MPGVGATDRFTAEPTDGAAVSPAADLVALERSPWDHPDTIEAIGVALMVVDGAVVFDSR